MPSSTQPGRPASGSDPASIPEGTPATNRGFSRRGILKGAVGAGAVTAFGGFVVESLVGSGGGTPDRGQSAVQAAATNPTSLQLTEPMVVHVRDAATGEIDLYVGRQQITYRDPQLVAQLIRAADQSI